MNKTIADVVRLTTGLAFLIGCAVLAHPAGAADSITLMGEAVAFGDGVKNNFGCSVALAADGKLVAVYRVGTGPDSGDGCIVMRKSSDGITYGPAQTIVPPINAGYGNRDVSLTCLKNGTLLASYVAYPNKQKPDCEVRIVHSIDNGMTWSQPAPVLTAPFVWAATRGRLFQLPSGVVLLPLYGNEQRVMHQDVAACLRSDNNGATWKEFTTVCKGAFNEHEYARLADGRLIAVVRREPSGDFGSDSARVYSRDQGKTWSAPASNGFVADAASLLADGPLLLMLYRPAPNGPSRLVLSGDNGQAWTGMTDLHPARGWQCAYGAIIKLPRGWKAPYYAVYTDNGQVYGRFFDVPR